MNELYKQIGNRILEYKITYKGKTKYGVPYYIRETDSEHIKTLTIMDCDAYVRIGEFNFGDFDDVRRMMDTVYKYRLCSDCDKSYYKGDNEVYNCIDCQMNYVYELSLVPHEEKVSCSICDNLHLRNSMKSMSCCKQLLCTSCAMKMIDDNSSCYFCRNDDYTIDW